MCRQWYDSILLSYLLTRAPLAGLLWKRVKHHAATEQSLLSMQYIINRKHGLVFNYCSPSNQCVNLIRVHISIRYTSLITGSNLSFNVFSRLVATTIGTTFGTLKFKSRTVRRFRN